MADLTHIFGGKVTVKEETRVDPPEEQLRTAIINAGLTPPDTIYLDGKIHRFRSGTKGTPSKSDKTGWYVAYGDGIPAGSFGCWRLGETVTWRADVGRTITMPEQMAITRRMAEAKAQRDAELKRTRDAVSNVVEEIWERATPATDEHPYLVRKGIKANGARVISDGRLVVPLYSADGTISSIQYIDAYGEKIYHPSGATGGKFWMVGTMDEPGVVYIAEGFATAATIHEATNRPVVVAYSANNLVSVTEAVVGFADNVVIVADNDASGVGQNHANQACAKFGVRMVMPPELGDANDYMKSGHDLKEFFSEKIEDEWLVSSQIFCLKPDPVKWHVKRWLQEKALIMVHGPSACGKTFVVLDMILHVAAGKEQWFGNRVKQGNIVYLAGEGHHGIKARVNAWRQHNGVSEGNGMYISKSGCDLNTPEGYQKVVMEIRRHKFPPKIIVVDTLHRFLLGDENSSQDAKSMLDACARLMEEFNCSVLLVHHTGVSEEAQHRARGSSAWRGALDIEISVVPGKNGGPIEIIQRKSKDAELADPLYAEIFKIQLEGWKDEDDEPVFSATLIQSNEKPVEKDKKPDKTAEKFKVFENAWFASGAEMRDGLPYVTKSALQDKLRIDGYAERSIKNNVAPSYLNGIVGYLINANIIQASGKHGWAVVAEHYAQTMKLKNETGK